MTNARLIRSAKEFHKLTEDELITQRMKLDNRYIEAMEEFSYKSAPVVLKKQDINLCYSPGSLYMALSLLTVGAEGKTSEELLATLKLNYGNSEFLAQQNRMLYETIYRDSDEGMLRLANSLWLRREGKYENSFIKSAVESYYTSLYRVKFNEVATAGLMNKWVEDNTDKLTYMGIKPDKNRALCMLNTLYFKGKWNENYFKKSNTSREKFYLNGGSCVNCEFMSLDDYFYTFKGDKFKSATIEMTEDNSVCFILPETGVSISEALGYIHESKIKSKQYMGKPRRVKMKVPKFSYGSSIRLTDALRELGVVQAFKAGADFGKLSKDIDKIDELAQASHIAIDENGIGAIGTTHKEAVKSEHAFSEEDDKLEMILNKPFIFVIRDDNVGVVIFIGVVNNPILKN